VSLTINRNLISVHATERKVGSTPFEGHGHTVRAICILLAKRDRGEQPGAKTGLQGAGVDACGREAKGELDRNDRNTELFVRIRIDRASMDRQAEIDRCLVLYRKKVAEANFLIRQQPDLFLSRDERLWYSSH
jgi:hypothetical protein